MAFKGEVLIEGPDGELEGPRENKTSLVWCYITPALDWFIPCGSVEMFYAPANGVLTVTPDHEHPMTVTRPG